MTWISINPDSEPQSSVKLAAHIVGTSPETITSGQMADAYNEVDASGQASTIQDQARINSFVTSISTLLDADSDEEVEEAEL